MSDEPKEDDLPTLEDLEKAFPWKWSHMCSKRAFSAEDPPFTLFRTSKGEWTASANPGKGKPCNTLHGTWKEAIMGALQDERAQYEYLRAELDERRGMYELALSVIDKGISRAERARAVLGDLGSILSECDDDAVADLIKGHLEAEGIAYTWDRGCTNCDGEGELTRGLWVHDCQVCRGVGVRKMLPREHKDMKWKT